jgi:hypothetical protein
MVVILDILEAVEREGRKRETDDDAHAMDEQEADLRQASN